MFHTFDGSFALKLPIDSPNCKDAGKHMAEFPNAVPSTEARDAPVESKGKEESQRKADAQIGPDGPLATDVLLATRS